MSIGAWEIESERARACVNTWQKHWLKGATVAWLVRFGPLILCTVHTLQAATGQPPARRLRNQFISLLFLLLHFSSCFCCLQCVCVYMCVVVVVVMLCIVSLCWLHILWHPIANQTVAINIKVRKRHILNAKHTQLSIYNNVATAMYSCVCVARMANNPSEWWDNISSHSAKASQPER